MDETSPPRGTIPFTDEVIRRVTTKLEVWTAFA
jgi:hypothetical protein